MFGYDPKTLKNNLVYRHEVDAVESQKIAAQPKPKPAVAPKKASPTSIAALQEKWRTR